MKLSNHKKTSTKGFTLIELLVVIAIIAALGGLSYGPILRFLETSDVNKTTKVCKDITFAITGFETEYDSLPYTGGTYPTADANVVTNAAGGRAFLEVLMGINTTINDKGKEFFNADQAEGDPATAKDGMVYNAGAIVSLLDKWGSPYTIRLDYDGNGVIDTTQIGTGDSYTNDLRVDDAVAASPGKDKLYNDVKDAKSW